MNRKQFIQSTLVLGAMTATRPLQALSETLTENGQKMPVLFIGHGNPMNAIEENEFSLKWRQLGKEIAQPKAVLCISAHWLTKGTHVTAMENPRTIHDFGGFPQRLFDVDYPAPGDMELAQRTQQIITSTEVGLDHDWGLDHGCWSVVKQMYPHADIPVLQLSIDYHKPAQYHYDLARELASLRRKGVLIIGSGNMVHNLRMVKVPRDGSLNAEAFAYDWCLEMNEAFKESILHRDHEKLIQYDRYGKAGKMAIPTPDHYFPLLYTLGLQEANEEAVIFNDRCLAGSLSMTSVQIG